MLFTPDLLISSLDLAMHEGSFHLLLPDQVFDQEFPDNSLDINRLSHLHNFSDSYPNNPSGTPNNSPTDGNPPAGNPLSSPSPDNPSDNGDNNPSDDGEEKKDENKSIQNNDCSNSTNNNSSGHDPMNPTNTPNNTPTNTGTPYGTGPSHNLANIDNDNNGPVKDTAAKLDAGDEEKTRKLQAEEIKKSITSNGKLVNAAQGKHNGGTTITIKDKSLENSDNGDRQLDSSKKSSGTIKKDPNAHMGSNAEGDNTNNNEDEGNSSDSDCSHRAPSLPSG